ncbi:hypothetical protein CYMTET_44689 [Cymbomonas tetramitiformis]|uniref:Uncharacterized protein n=1 Tax=Cymbomonas tetramitiformis TaxID=36881 RepID=A0AAE0C145_9CHLO|nr:hypothetical protein CYMTET_44689 [Cymbomonas tetramitiformis]
MKGTKKKEEHAKWMKMLRHPEEHTEPPDPRSGTEIVKVNNIAYYVAKVGTEHTWEEYKKLQLFFKKQVQNKKFDEHLPIVTSQAYRYVKNEYSEVEFAKKYCQKIFQSFVWIKNLKRGESCPRLPLNLADRLHRQSFTMDKGKITATCNNRCSKFDNFPEGAVAPLVCTRYYHNQVRPRSGSVSSATLDDNCDVGNKSRKRSASVNPDTIYPHCVKLQKARLISKDTDFFFPLQDMLPVKHDEENGNARFESHFDEHVACCVHQLMDAIKGDKDCAPDVYSTKPESLFRTVAKAELVRDVTPFFKRIFIDDAPENKQHVASQLGNLAQVCLSNSQQQASDAAHDEATDDSPSGRDKGIVDNYQIASSNITTAYESAKEEIRILAKQYARLIFEKCMSDLSRVNQPHAKFGKL